MGIFYTEEDELRDDQEYEAWFKKTLRDIESFNTASRKTKIYVGDCQGGKPVSKTG